MRRARDRVIAVAAGAALSSACTGSDGDPRSIEDAAWIGAGVDDPVFSTEDSGPGVDLDVRVDTRLPIDDANEPMNFARRAAQIVWRTRAQAFDELTVTIAHDGAVVGDPVTYSASALETAYGPRPAGLDNGVDRADVEPDPDGELRAITEEADATNLATVRSTVTVPVLTTTLVEHFDSAAVITADEPEECMGGVNGNEPTGRFRVTDTAVAVESNKAKALLEDLVEYWHARGLDVNTAPFDHGQDTVQVRFDGLGTVVALAGDDALLLQGLTDCHEPG